MSSLRQGLSTSGVELLGRWVIEAWDSGWRPNDYVFQDDIFILNLREHVNNAMRSTPGPNRESSSFYAEKR